MVFPILLGVGAAVAAVAAVTTAIQRKPSTPQPPKSTLHTNLARLKRLLDTTSCPKIVLLGQPGAGKSSLLRMVAGSEVIPQPKIGLETDTTNWAQSDQVQLMSHWGNQGIIDVPGYDTQTHPADVMVEHFAQMTFDAAIFVFNNKLKKADEDMFKAVAPNCRHVLIVRNHAENLDDDERRDIEQDLKQRLHTSWPATPAYARVASLAAVAPIAAVAHLAQAIAQQLRSSSIVFASSRTGLAREPIREWIFKVDSARSLRNA